MAENIFWIIAAIVIVIVVIIALLSLFGVNIGPFSTHFNRVRLGSNLCNQLSTNGCTDYYRPELENTQCGIRYDEIGQRLRDPNNKDAGVNKARFGEVCEYLGFKDFDDCLKYCGCKLEK
jgi:hypothetical protein